MRMLLRVLFLMAVYFLTAMFATAQPRLVCVNTVCRYVETGPIARPFAQDLNAVPPKPAAKARVADWKFWAVTAGTIGISVATTKSLVDCRHDHGIGPCVDGGYGEFRAREVLRNGLAVGINLITYQINRIEDDEDHKFKTWWLMPVGVTAWNAATMVRNKVHTYPPKEIE